MSDFAPDPMRREQLRGSVIAAFPATGKSYLAAATGMLDSDSSRYSWEHTGPETRRRHPGWPSNYLHHIQEAMAGGQTVLVSTHGEVRTALEAAGVPFTLVYPLPFLREEYRQRMVERGSPDELVRKVVDELWDGALLECAAQTGCVHAVLRAGEYLADVVPVPNAGREVLDAS